MDDIEKAFKHLTANGRGTTKAETRLLCGDAWNEKAWRKMVNAANAAKNRVGGGELPFYDKETKLWYWY